jgi:hypothetical protein
MNSLIAISIADALPIAAAGRDVAAACEADPIFALIEDHRKLQATRLGLWGELDDAEHEAAKEHGQRPLALISWRNYTIGGLK